MKLSNLWLLSIPALVAVFGLVLPSATGQSRRDTHYIIDRPVNNEILVGEPNAVPVVKSRPPTVDADHILPMPLPTRVKPSAPRSVDDKRLVSHDLITGETIVHRWQRRRLPAADQAGSSSSGGGDIGIVEPDGGVLSFFTDLELIPNPHDYPWRVNVRLSVLFYDETGTPVVRQCSGVLIDPKHVLTAGHCIYAHTIDNHVINDWASAVTVQPAYQLGGLPYGGANATNLYSWAGWTQNESFNYDMGVIYFQRPVGALTGWHDYGYNEDPFFFFFNTFHNPSYPGDRPYDGQYMYYRYGPFDSAFGENLLQALNTSYGGQSGSCAYHVGNNARTVYAVLSNTGLFGFPTNFVSIWPSGFINIRDDAIDANTPPFFDLIPLRVIVGPDELDAGASLSELQYTVHNYASASWNGTVNVHVYLSDDDTIDTSDTLISTRQFTYAFGPKSTVVVTATQNLPVIPECASEGYRWIGIILDIADYDTGNNDSSGQWDSSEIFVFGNQPPAVGSLEATPETITQGDILNLAAYGVMDPNSPNGLPELVQFYHDSNDSHSFEEGIDAVIATDDDPFDGGWFQQVSTDSFFIGENWLFARAQDGCGEWSNVVWDTVVVIDPDNQLPTIGSLTAEPDPVIQGEPLTLTANDVSDPDGSVELVEFYRDSNGNGQVDEGVDDFLDVDGNPAGGWQVIVSTSSFPLGVNQLLARAQDDGGAWSAAASTSVVVEPPPPPPCDAILYVPPYPSIQAAIDAACDDSAVVVLVYPGTYYENINFLGKAITVASYGGPEVTIIDGQFKGSVVTCNSWEGPDTVLQGFTIRYGMTTYDDGGSNGWGGGMFNHNASPTIINCKFFINFADYGAGMANLGGLSPIVTDCVFTNNFSTASGGGMLNWYSSPSVSGCIFTDNSATSGGGMSNLVVSTPTVTNCTFSGNTADWSGGGIYNGGGKGKKSTAIVAGSIFCENIPDHIGGEPIDDGGGNCFADTCDDANGNGIPDECECTGDLDGSGDVGVKDLLILLGAWGPNPGHPADFDGSGDVGVKDLLVLLGNWGACP